ncbi:MAG: hypothetical protein CGW95_01595 [Phenylobacterium zucineum]|nr:MAG: hypothetical protein CGW95_01595 [Phenylobacterium zucineum]
MWDGSSPDHDHPRHAPRPWRPSYRFTIPGQPRGKGRPRFGRGRTYTDAKTLAYEQTVRTSAKSAIGPLGPFSGPVAAFLTFRLCPARFSL